MAWGSSHPEDMDAYSTLHRSTITTAINSGGTVTITGTDTPHVWQVMTSTRTITFHAPGCASLEQLLHDVRTLVGEEDTATDEYRFAIAV
jgi:hypothetical protein